jgi:predicted DNA-binding transcriptional regulator AlpA
MIAAEKLPERQAEALLLKPATVARQLEIGQRTLWRWVSTGQFPAPDLRMGSKVVRWRAATVTGWIDAKAREGGR